MNTLQDFYAAAFLIASGVPMVDHYKVQRMTTFVFADTERVTNLLEVYYSMQASIEPVRYGNAIRNLKSIIHASK